MHPWKEVSPGVMGHKRLQCTSEYDPSDECERHPGRCCVGCEEHPRCRLRGRCKSTDDCYTATKEDLDLNKR